MAKKVVASLRDKSGVKYAKLIKSVKSEKTGAYVFKEEIVICLLYTSPSPRD